MSIISSKQEKRQGLFDPISVLFFLVLILAFLVFAPFTGNAYNSINSVSGSLDNAPAGLSASGAASFASDQQYWSANCSYGWSSNSTCDNIVLRSQSCTIGVASAYCSEYDNYLQDFRN